MRGIVYGIAVLAAAGIMYYIAVIPSASVPVETNAVATSTPSVMPEAGMVTLSVPTMHCAVACYPTVKETLESTSGVTEVVLDEQKEEGLIDNRQVIVTYEAGFDVGAALALLSEKGFEDANVVQ